MAEPFLGEIRLFAFGRVPSGWAPCDGRLMQINMYQPLFALLGNTYGGNSSQGTFALPDLRGRVPVHRGNGVTYGQAGGANRVALAASQMPSHTHTIMGSASPADNASPTGRVWADQTLKPYGTQPTAALNAAALDKTGGEPHENMQPYGVASYCIALQGIFPTRD